MGWGEETDRDIEGQTMRETDRQRHRGTNNERDRQTDRDIEGKTMRKRDRQTETYRDKQ